MLPLLRHVRKLMVQMYHLRVFHERNSLHQWNIVLCVSLLLGLCVGPQI